MTARPENPKIIFFRTMVLSLLYIQNVHDFWTATKEREMRRNGDDLPPPHMEVSPGTLLPVL